MLRLALIVTAAVVIVDQVSKFWLIGVMETHGYQTQTDDRFL